MEKKEEPLKDSNNPENSGRKKRRIKVGRKERREAGKVYKNVCVCILYIYIFTFKYYFISLYICRYYTYIIYLHMNMHRTKESALPLLTAVILGKGV